jgi:hypothetical protein
MVSLQYLSAKVSAVGSELSELVSSLELGLLGELTDGSLAVE